MTRRPEQFTDRPNPRAFIDVVRLLRSRTTLWGTIQAAGRWGVSFPKRDDLLFFRVDCGSCQFIREGTESVVLTAGDVILVRTTASFTLTSDPAASVIDSWTLVASTGSREMRLGGEVAPVRLRGGRLVFDAGMEKSLGNLLPSFVHITPEMASWGRVRALLEMNEVDSATKGSQSRFTVQHLMDLLLVELQGSEPVASEIEPLGILAGSRDPVSARALEALHADIARRWTTVELARLCGRSRSGFSAHFSQTFGVGPMTYLQRWRMAVARDELAKGTHSVTEIAFRLGFRSSSAFSTAFNRAVGCSPRRWTEYSHSDSDRFKQ